MAEHGRHATFSQILFHACTRMAQLGRFKYRRANAEPLPTQRIEIDTFYHQIAPEQSGVDAISPEEMRRLCNELFRNDGSDGKQ